MALEGSLEDMSVIDLFQVFRIGPKTGVLRLATTASHAMVYVDQGQPIDASIVQIGDEQPLANGEIAVLELLQWSQATFCFHHDPRVRERPPRIFRDSETLVLESLRRRHELQGHVPQPTITLDTRLTMALLPSNGPSSVSLDLNQWRILSQIALCGTVRNICAQTQSATDEVLRISNELFALGLIEIVRETVPTYPPPRKLTPSPLALQPGAGSTGSMPAKTAPSIARPGKTLLNAVMRRVRGL